MPRNHAEAGVNPYTGESEDTHDHSKEKDYEKKADSSSDHLGPPEPFRNAVSEAEKESD